MIVLVLLIAAFILFVLSAIPIASRINLMGAGLACWVLAELVGHAGLLR